MNVVKLVAAAFIITSVYLVTTKPKLKI